MYSRDLIYVHKVASMVDNISGKVVDTTLRNHAKID